MGLEISQGPRLSLLIQTRMLFLRWAPASGQSCRLSPVLLRLWHSVYCLCSHRLPGMTRRQAGAGGARGRCPGCRLRGGLSRGGGSRRTSPCGQGGPYHPTLGLQATEGVTEDPSPLPPPPALLCSAFSPRRGCPSFPASHSILMPALPAWVAKDTRGGVITGHSSPRVRTEEAQPSAGTHQSPNQALAAGGKGRAARGKGVPANFS